MSLVKDQLLEYFFLLNNFLNFPDVSPEVTSDVMSDFIWDYMSDGISVAMSDEFIGH